MKTWALLIPFCVALALPAASHATSHGAAPAGAHAQHHVLADGEVRRVDRDAGKLTIRHGPLANLDMPPMTMVFQVKDPAMLEQVNVGDKVRFSADRVNGSITIVAMEPAR